MSRRAAVLCYLAEGVSFALTIAFFNVWPTWVLYVLIMLPPLALAALSLRGRRAGRRA